MKLLDNILYLEFSDLADCGVSEGYIKKAKSVGAACWTFINDPLDRRKVLIQHDKLKVKYQEMVQEKFGNPYDYVAKQPIKDLVENDLKAREFFFSYRFNVDKSLPEEHVNSYAKAANWLNMLNKLNQDKKYIKKQLCLSLTEFFDNVCDIIRAEKIELPATYQRLRTKMKEYEETGYKCIIDWRFGNSNATKVGDEVCESMLLELIAHPNQHDDVIIAKAYNSWALNHGYKPISDGTVGNHRRKNYHLLQGYREGNAAAYNTYGKHIMRNRPTAPLLLVGSDDNDLDLYFQEDNKKGGINYYHRFKLILVVDAFNDYILGYSYGDTVTTDLIKAAFLDAQHHVKELTSGWYLPHQLQTDRWGKGTLNDWYESFTTYTPATAKVARAKYIEQSFGKKWHSVLKMYPNYAGTNITSQGRINRDVMELNKKEFPTKDKAYLQIEDFITRMRLEKDTTGKTRQASWLEAFQASELAQEKRISDARMIATFGSPHSYTNTITNGGLKVALEGIERVYDIPDEFYLQNVGKKVQVIYDPYDYSRVLITDDDKLRFVAHEYKKLPSAIADYQPGDRARLNAALLQKKQHMERIAASKDKRQAVLEENYMDAASLLQAGVLIKELKQNAEIAYQQGSSRTSYDPLDQM